MQEQKNQNKKYNYGKLWSIAATCHVHKIIKLTRFSPGSLTHSKNINPGNVSFREPASSQPHSKNKEESS